MERRRLSSDELARALSHLNGWDEEDGQIKKSFKFENFAESLAFVNKIGALAEKSDHHPDIAFGWGYARISLSTHDRGGITDVDIAAARQIDSI
jgi:4a-hydroxytetrahydrobiopterin dehydratase